MQPIQVDFTSIIFDVVTSLDGFVALFFLSFLLAKIYDLVSKRGLEGEIIFQSNKAYDSYIAYLDEKKYSKQTLEVYDPLDDLHGYEDRLSEYRQRKSDGLDGISASSFSFSDGGHSGDHLIPYSPNGKDPYIDFSLFPDTSKTDDVYIDDNGMDVYLTWDEIDKHSSNYDNPINNEDYIPLIDEDTESSDIDSLEGLLVPDELMSENLHASDYFYTDDSYYSYSI